VVLPRNAAILEEIEGPACTTRKEAKQRAALEACKRLREAKALTKRFKPKGSKAAVAVVATSDHDERPVKSYRIGIPRVLTRCVDDEGEQTCLWYIKYISLLNTIDLTGCGRRNKVMR